jgi:hypothetical protein
VLRLDFVLDRRIPQEVSHLDRDFLERGTAMGADRRHGVVFGGEGGVVRGLGDGIARERLIEASETECLPRFEHGSGLLPELGRERRYGRRLFELRGEFQFEMLHDIARSPARLILVVGEEARDDGLLAGLGGFQGVDSL